MLHLEDIIEIRKSSNRSGYEIVFPENRIIWVTKRRTLSGLLLLIKYEYCSEADLVGTNNRLVTIKNILKGKIDPSWIQDRYGDANKPFSELWTEEGFSCVHAEAMHGNRQYVLHPSDHNLLFQETAKSIRVQLSPSNKEHILLVQSYRCNICGAFLKPSSQISPHTFAKDRVRIEFDHRIPIDRGGKNSIENLQALCHYCNKCKRQMCFVCHLESCSPNCALVYPEHENFVLATGENILDRITKR